MPGAPLFWHTCFSARCRLVRSSTCSSNAPGGIDAGLQDDPVADSSSGFPAAGGSQLADAVPFLSVMFLRLLSFGPSAEARLLCPLLTSVLRSGLITQPSVVPPHRTDLPG